MSREYSNQDLEAQYNNMRRVPEAQALLDQWAQRSAEVRAREPCRLDLAYGDAPRQRLDLFPAASERAPLLIYVHGGYWQRGDKSMYSFVAPAPRALGLHVALVSYGLCPDTPFDQIATHVCEAVAWIVQHADELDLDPSQIFIAGHSAGAHLAATVLATDLRHLSSGLPRAPLAGALLISGIYDLPPLIPTSENVALSLDQELAERLSPLRMRPLARCPVVLAVGADESAEFRRQTRDLQRAWGGQLAAERIEVAGANHFTVLEQLAASDGELCGALARMLSGELAAGVGWRDAR